MKIPWWQLALAVSILLISGRPATAEDSPGTIVNPATPPVDGSPTTETQQTAAITEGHSFSGSGSAAAETDRWTKNYNAGLTALDHRVYDIAAKRLLTADREANKNGMENARMVQARVALGRLYLAVAEYGRAERMFSTALPLARRFFGAYSVPVAEILEGLAEIEFLKGNSAKAERQCQEAFGLLERRLGPDSREFAKCMDLLAKIKTSEGWLDEAEPLLKRAVSILDKNPGPQRLDQAEALRDLGLFYQSQGRNAEAESPFERALTIREAAARFDQSATLRGNVIFRWDPGAPGSAEIPDARYPFRYINTDKLRVAATLVHVGRSSGGRFYGALISLTNTDPQRSEIGIGPVSLQMVKPGLKFLTPLWPDKVDRIYWERAVWDLTWRNTQLANSQTTRSSVGYLRGALPDLHNNYGGNDFGTYGLWGAGPRSIPDIVARERMHARGESILEPGVALATSIGALNLNPVNIGPMESRTGIMFFHNLAFQEAILRVTVGNSTFEFPFHTVEPW